MTYIEPGVRTLLQPTAATTTAASIAQEPALIGELYEVFEDEPAVAHYNANSGLGNQSVVWPGKKTNSIVDLAGIRSDTAEPDDQLMEDAAVAGYPMAVSIQDPVTLAKVALNPVTDIETVSQTGFQIVQGVAAAVARISGGTSSAAESNKIRSADGGFVAAGVSIGDKVRVELDEVGEIVHGTVTAFTDSEITYSSSDEVVVDDAYLAVEDGDALTNSGKINTADTSDLTVGDRVAIYTEAAQVDDADLTVANTVSSVTGFGLTDADIGRKITLWSRKSADGQKSCLAGTTEAPDGGNENTNTITDGAASIITSADVGKVVRISGGDTSQSPTYRRILTAGTGTATVSGDALVDDVNVDIEILGPLLRTIESINEDGSFVYDGATATIATNTDATVVLHTRVLRDVTVIDSSTRFTYSGSAVTSETGFKRLLPIEFFGAGNAFTVFPDYRVLVSYRALDISARDGIRVASLTELAALGSISKHNPLFWAAKAGLAAMGTTTRNVLLIGINPWSEQDTPTGLPTDRDTSTAYAAAAALMASDGRAYYKVPLIVSETIAAMFSDHVTAVSDEDAQCESVAYVTRGLPLGEVESSFLAGSTPVIEPGRDGGNRLILDAAIDFVSEFGIEPGDSVVITAPADYAGTYEVAADTADGVLALEGDNWPLVEEFAVTDANFNANAGRVSTSTTTAAGEPIWKDVDVGDWIKKGSSFRRITSRTNTNGTDFGYAGAALTGTSQSVTIIRSRDIVYHVNPLTKDQQATALKEWSADRANKRMVHIWPDICTMVTGADEDGDDVIEELPSYFAAAAEACRDSVLPPARSSTGSTLGGIVGVKNALDYFTRTQLNIIAEGGTTILWQETPGAAVKCRHLLTTDMTSSKTKELSKVKNVDNMAKVVRASMAPSLNDENGRKLITPKLLDALMLPYQAILRTFADADEPQLVEGPNGEPPFIASPLIQDPNNEDRILAPTNLNDPTPANNMDVIFTF